MSRDELARAAITRARARARQAWKFQTAGVLVVAVVLGLGIWQVWRHSEIRAVTVQTTTRSPAPLPTGATPASVQPAWRSTEPTASGQPVQQDVVVTYSEHAVHGRDASTGAIRWSYSRSDRNICDVVAQNSTVVAIYEHDGLCDEVTGLDAGSGARRWVRTLLSSGTPSTLTVSSRDSNLLLVTPGSTELIEPSGGLDWWYQDQSSGCTAVSAVLGQSGVLSANRCSGGDTLTFRLLGNSKAQAWSVALSGRTPLSADLLTTVLAANGRSVDSLNTASGRVKATIALPAAVSPTTAPQAVVVTSLNPTIEVVPTTTGLLALIDQSQPALVWQRPGRITLPTVVSVDLLTLASANSVLRLDARTGTTVASTRLAAGSGPPPAVADSVVLLGRGLLVSGADGTIAYR